MYQPQTRPLSPIYSLFTIIPITIISSDTLLKLIFWIKRKNICYFNDVYYATYDI